MPAPCATTRPPTLLPGLVRRTMRGPKSLELSHPALPSNFRNHNRLGLDNPPWSRRRAPFSTLADQRRHWACSGPNEFQPAFSCEFPCIVHARYVPPGVHPLPAGAQLNQRTCNRHIDRDGGKTGPSDPPSGFVDFAEFDTDPLRRSY